MANPEWTDPLAWEECANCGRQEVREALDGDPLCQSCCEKWARGEGEWDSYVREQERQHYEQLDAEDAERDAA